MKLKIIQLITNQYDLVKRIPSEYRIYLLESGNKKEANHESSQLASN